MIAVVIIMIFPSKMKRGGGENQPKPLISNLNFNQKLLAMTDGGFN
jgi:hypothetical protein